MSVTANGSDHAGFGRLLHMNSHLPSAYSAENWPSGSNVRLREQTRAGFGSRRTRAFLWRVGEGSRYPNRWTLAKSGRRHGSSCNDGDTYSFNVPLPWAVPA